MAVGATQSQQPTVFSGIKLVPDPERKGFRAHWTAVEPNDGNKNKLFLKIEFTGPNGQPSTYVLIPDRKNTCVSFEDCLTEAGATPPLPIYARPNKAKLLWVDVISNGPMAEAATLTLPNPDRDQYRFYSSIFKDQENNTRYNLIPLQFSRRELKDAAIFGSSCFVSEIAHLEQVGWDEPKDRWEMASAFRYASSMKDGADDNIKLLADNLSGDGADAFLTGLNTSLTRTIDRLEDADDTVKASMKERLERSMRVYRARFAYAQPPADYNQTGKYNPHEDPYKPAQFIPPNVRTFGTLEDSFDIKKTLAGVNTDDTSKLFSLSNFFSGPEMQSTEVAGSVNLLLSTLHFLPFSAIPALAGPVGFMLSPVGRALAGGAAFMLYASGGQLSHLKYFTTGEGLLNLGEAMLTGLTWGLGALPSNGLYHVFGAERPFLKNALFGSYSVLGPTLKGMANGIGFRFSHGAMTAICDTAAGILGNLFVERLLY